VKFVVTLRCTQGNAESYDRLAAVLEGLPGVETVNLDKTSHVARVTYRGALDGLRLLDRAESLDGARARVVSHAHLILTVKALDGADPRKLEARLTNTAGVKKVTLAGGSAELFADLDTLSYPAMREAIAGAGYEGKITSHQWLTLTLARGDAAALTRELLATAGILSVRPAPDGALNAWTFAKFDDATLQLIAELADARLGEIQRR
jgi:hypothetical protein